MGRAPNLGAPQRVSAHVVPKALSPFADEDEKTTIESGWEEEASTTVEQGEVAEKIRTLGLRPITNVTGSGVAMDEPTMDDQHVNAGLSVVTPPMLQARMIITAGNDQGQEIDIIPGKTYTVGRAIDNDIVLTDIAVSRKHFDLRFENASWVLIDRGSGNGTVINGSIEDAPFMLANGDSIEIGNTTFRYDNPNGMPRHSASGFSDHLQNTNDFAASSSVVTRDGSAGFDIDLEEEPSTVAGKPLREMLEPPPQHLPSPFAPPRARAVSARPELPRPKTVPPPMPPPAPLPRKQAMSNPPPHFGAAIAAPMSQPAMPALQPQMLAAPPPMMPHGGVYGSQPVPAIGSNRPTMLANGPAPEHMHGLVGMMPTTIPGQGPPIQPSSPQVHALPFTYPNLANMPEHVQHVQHASAQHAQMLVVGNQVPRDATATAHVPPTPYNGLPVMQPYVAPTLSRRTKLLLGGAGLSILAAIATIAIIKGGDAAPSEADNTPVKAEPTKPVVQPIDDKPTKKDPPKEIKKDPPKEIVKKDPPKDPPKEIKKDPPKEAIVAKDPPKEIKKDPPKDPPKEIKKDPPKEVVKKDPPPKKDPPKEIKKEPVRVAVATVKPDSSGAADKAKGLYQQKKFLEAATTLKAAAGADSGLRTLALGYEMFAKNYAIGTRPTAKALDAWIALRSALNFDTNFGNSAHKDDIQARRAQVAPKAALGLASAKNFTEAAVALKLADPNNSDAQFARRLVNDYAAELYETAKGEIDSNRSAALNKLRQVKLLTGSGALFSKAEKLLNANPG